MPKAITFSRYGGPEVLTISDVEIPPPGPGQVRIQVKAVSVNPIDVKIRSGAMDGIMPVNFPVLPGWDVAGVVESAGEGAAAAVGDEVLGVASVGGYSELAVLDRPVAKPEGVPWESAAAFITVGEAAFRVLKHLGIKRGQTLLVLGAGGSVGIITVQLALLRGIAVIGVAGGGDHDRLAALGATPVLSGENWPQLVRAAAPGGVDAVVDTAGAGLLPDAVALVGDPARVITIADHAAAEHGVRFTGADHADRFPEAIPELAELLGAGTLTVPIWRTYPLANAANAHADLEAGRNNGKIILVP